MKKFKLLCKIMQSSLNAISLNFRHIVNIEILAKYQIHM